MTGRALIARLDSVGDVLLAGPAVRAVAASPDVDEVWMLASSIGAPAARLLPEIDGVITWDCPWITASAHPITAEHLARLDTAVRELAPETAVVLTSFHQSPLPLALQLRLAGVPRIIGASVDYAGSLLDVRLKPGEDFPEDQPEPLRALAIAEAAGFTLPPEDDGRLRLTGLPPLSAGLDLRAGLEPPAGLEPNAYVVVHPGASVSSRRWPAGHHEALVRLLTDSGMPVVVTGGPGETDLTAQVAGTTALDLGGDTPLSSLAAVLAGASVVVTGNTGPAHIAAAVGTPVVSLFSPVVPAARWAPYGVPHILLGDQAAACAGTRATACPVAGHPCLTSVTPEDVVRAVRAFGAPVAPEREPGVDLEPEPEPAHLEPTTPAALTAALDLAHADLAHADLELGGRR